MDDPIFDPWGAAVERAPNPATEPAAPRWRSPLVTSPGVPVMPAVSSLPTRVPETTSAPARATLPGSAGFLRTVAAPRLERIANRLRMARHAATVEDLLGESQPVLRLVVRPWHESLSRRPRPERSRLEIAPPRAGDDAVVVRMWLDCATADRPDEEDRIHESKLSVPLVEALILDFLGRVLLTA